MPTKTRIPNDKYYTETRLTQVLTDRVSLQGRILECCAGERHIYNELIKLPNVEVIGTDLTDVPSQDATTLFYWSFWKDGFSPDWVITNPPFNQASKIIPLAYSYADRGVCMLLRLTYQEPCKDRANWLQDNSDQLRMVIPVNPRPRFRSDSKGSDSATVAWFVWEKQWSWTRLGVVSPFQYASEWNK